ncbi:MAG: CpsB/CapC family capsule biosynthesis tyrosine phosphatase [Clostridium sp.]
MYDLNINILSKKICTDEDYDLALKSVKSALDSGVKKIIISTKELNKEIDVCIKEMEERLTILEEKINSAKIDIKLYIAKSIKINEVNDFINNRVSNKSEYVFIDINKNTENNQIKDIIFELSLVGVVPIIQSHKSWNEEVRLEILNENLHKNNIDMEMYLDKSITLSKTYINDYLDGKLEDITKTKYMLVNLNDTMTDEKVDLVFELTLRGIVPIIIHPEKCKEIIEKISRIEKLKEIGCLFQLDINSLSGLNGKESKKCAKKLLRGNIYHLISKEMNEKKSNGETTKIVRKKSFVWVSRKKKIRFETNSRKLLNNENITIEESKKKTKKISVRDGGVSYY